MISIAEACRLYDLSRPQMLRILAWSGDLPPLSRKGRPRIVDEAVVSRAVRAWLARMSCAEASRRLGIDEHIMRGALRDARAHKPFGHYRVTEREALEAVSR